MAEDLIDYELDGEAPDDIEPIQGEPELYEHFRTVVDKGQAPVRIDKYLFERIVNASRNGSDGCRQRIRHGQRETVKSSYKVKPLDVLTVMMDRPRYENDIIPEDIPLNIVYEDDDLMVINKPAGLVVHPDVEITTVPWSTPSHGICVTSRPITRMTRKWDWCTALTRIPQDFWW